MLKLVPFLLLIVVLLGAPPVTRAEEPKKTAPQAQSSPAPKKPSFFSRIFGRRKKPAPTPQASPTPKPVKAKSSPRPSASPASNSATPTPTPKRVKPKASPSPLSETPVEHPPTDTLDPSKTPGATIHDHETHPAIPGPAEDEKERARFAEVREKALEDKKIQELKERADGADEGDEATKASKEFYQSLFSKMRKLDGSLKDRIDRSEAAMMRRLEQK